MAQVPRLVLHAQVEDAEAVMERAVHLVVWPPQPVQVDVALVVTAVASIPLMSQVDSERLVRFQTQGDTCTPNSCSTTDLTEQFQIPILAL